MDHIPLFRISSSLPRCQAQYDLFGEALVADIERMVLDKLTQARTRMLEHELEASREQLAHFLRGCGDVGSSPDI